jgi:hypothetical protein
MEVQMTNNNLTKEGWKVPENIITFDGQENNSWK